MNDLQRQEAHRGTVQGYGLVGGSGNCCPEERGTIERDGVNLDRLTR